MTDSAVRHSTAVSVPGNPARTGQFRTKLAPRDREEETARNSRPDDGPTSRDTKNSDPNVLQEGGAWRLYRNY